MVAPNPAARIAPSGPLAGGFTGVDKFENVAVPDTAIAASSASVISVPVPGAEVGDMVILNGIVTNFPAGLVLGAAFVVNADGFIRIQVANLTTGGPIQTGSMLVSGALVHFRD